MMQKPRFTKALLLDEIQHLAGLSKDIVIKELLHTLAYIILPGLNEDIPPHALKGRLQTIYSSFRNFICTAILLPVKYCLFFITTFIEAAFDVVSLILILGFMVFQVPFGAALNLLFLLFNNLLVHTALLGLLSHSACFIFALIGSPIDPHARLKLCEYGKLLIHDLRSLYEVIITLLHPKHLIYTLIGLRHLEMSARCDHLEEKHPNESPSWFFGLYSAIPKALSETFKFFTQRLDSLASHLLFMLFTPVFLILSLLEASLHGTLCVEKTALTPAVWIIGKGHSVVNKTISKPTFPDCSPSPLLV